MNLKSPQTELPRNSIGFFAITGGSDFWDIEPAGQILTEEYFGGISKEQWLLWLGTWSKIVAWYNDATVWKTFQFSKNDAGTWQ